MFAMGKYSSSNPSHGFVALSLKLFVARGPSSGRRIGDILNSLRGNAAE
jgi:hypothetical protein